VPHPGSRRADQGAAPAPWPIATAGDATARDGARPPLLELDGFGVAFRERVVLADVTLRLGDRGVCVLMGPAGGGKSTLLRTLAGVNQAQPDLRQWGTARFGGEPLSPGNYPALVQQDLRHFTATVRENLASSLPDRAQLGRAAQTRRIEELLIRCDVPELLTCLDEEALTLAPPLRRLLSVLRATAAGAPLLCLDETTAGLELAGAERLLQAVRRYAADHAVLFVTHHQGQARSIADRVVLLAGGRIQEDAAARDFFADHSSPIARHFRDTGGIAIPSPDAAPEDLDDAVAAPAPLPERARAPVDFVGPRDFRWLHAGRLGGLPRPGIIADVAEDLAGLGRLGVTTLLTVEETETVPAEALAAAGIASAHFPIVDMEAPDERAAAHWCEVLEARLAAGEVIAVHCRAGQGRTGTVLACQLIWAGATAIEALDRVRSINPRWVTSDSQVRFLARFAAHVRQLRSSPPAR
jgi:atypical dual specificity phosphatase